MSIQIMFQKEHVYGMCISYFISHSVRNIAESDRKLYKFQWNKKLFPLAMGSVKGI